MCEERERKHRCENVCCVPVNAYSEGAPKGLNRLSFARELWIYLCYGGIFSLFWLLSLSIPLFLLSRCYARILSQLKFWNETLAKRNATELNQKIKRLQSKWIETNDFICAFVLKINALLCFWLYFFSYFFLVSNLHHFEFEFFNFFFSLILSKMLMCC